MANTPGAIQDKSAPTVVTKTPLMKRLRSQKQLMFMSLPIVAYILVFSYYPIWGWVMAFQNYSPAKKFSQRGVGRT